MSRVAVVARDASSGAITDALAGHRAVQLAGFWEAATCRAMTGAVMTAEDRWTSAFGGEQWSLGRAFYAHLETQATRDYFAHATASDAVVEATLPGFQRTLRETLGRLLGVTVRARRGWCGPGVHVFTPGSKVARLGGVVHFDLEGLTEVQRARRVPAVTLVVMLQPALRGGGLRLWETCYTGRNEAALTPDERTPVAAETVLYGEGDAVLMDSYRLHQIAPFAGEAARVSATLHAVQVDRGVWEAWF